MARLIDRRRTMQVVDYSKKFLTIVSLEDSNVIKWRTNDSSLKRTIYVSTDDGATWGQVISSTSGATLATLNKGDRLLIKYASSAAYGTGSYYCYFSSTKNFKVEGNIMSLTTDGDFSTIDTVDTYAFKYLFADCTKLKDASNLILPATTLAGRCYERMFSGCSGMETGPKILPATTLTTYCYDRMFSGCTSLTTAPEILATNLGSSSQSMGLCRNMFSGCSSLNKIKCLAVNNITTFNLQNWVYGVAETGTFIKDDSATDWTIGTNGIPVGWVANGLKSNISNATVIVENLKYTGNPLTPTVIVRLGGTTIPSSGYTVAYSNNTAVGTATVTVTGIGNYEGEAIGTFLIVNQLTGSVSFTNHSYTKHVDEGNFTVTAEKTGDGTLTYSSSDTSVATVNANTGAVTIVGTGTTRITAYMAETINYTNASDYYDLTIISSAFSVGTVKSFSYTGTVQSQLLVPGTYKLQCWGAQGGSNASNSTYGITALSGGKGGYSVGLLTVPNDTTVYIFVGGQGSSSGNGGWNGGGGSSGSSSYSSSGGRSVSMMGCGGGATDIALVSSSMDYSNYRNERNNNSLLSRMIVAGGGSGGAMCYNDSTIELYIIYKTASGTSSYLQDCGWCIGTDSSNPTYYNKWFTTTTNYTAAIIDVSAYKGGTAHIFHNDTVGAVVSYALISTYPTTNLSDVSYAGDFTSVRTFSSGASFYLNIGLANYLYVYKKDTPDSIDNTPKRINLSKTVSSTSSQTGYFGGGTEGGGYSDIYKGKLNSYGQSGDFGIGANALYTTYKYCSAAGGGGWYGGGSDGGDSNMDQCKYSGGGSGFVNTSENASYRPSGYSGLLLNSGSTYAGNTSFESIDGETETGHTGNGYAKITRMS